MAKLQPLALLSICCRDIALVLGLTAATMAQTTWIVDSSGAGQFTSLELAYDAASPGDILLVRPGTYLGFSRPAKGVRLQATATAGAPATILGTLRLWGLPAGQQLWIEGFQMAVFSALTPGSPHGLTLTDCPDVVLSSSTVTASQPAHAMPPGEAVQLQNTTCLMSHVTATGGRGYFQGLASHPGGVGLRAVSSRVTLANCTIRSGDNGTTGHGEGTADALVALSSDIVIDDCLVQPGIPGAMTVSPPRSLFATNGRMLVGNRNNQIVAPVTLAGSASLEFDGALTATASSLPLSPRSQPSLSGPNSVQRGGTIQWLVAGAPGSVGVTARSLGSQPLALPAMFDTLLFTAPHPTASLQGAFVVPASGQATLSLQVPNLPQLVGEHVLQQAVGWLGQPTLKATGVVVTVVL